MTELYKKYRPAKLVEMVGQDTIIESVREMILKESLPRALLLSGPSGCGKTTMARILRKALKCSEMDFTEMNSADDRGVEAIRKIRSRMNLAPIQGKCRIWLLDECHSMTAVAQQALLKILEDTPSHVYFFLCTTDPQKLIKTIRTRCTELRFQSISPEDASQLISDIAEKEEKNPPSDSVIEAITEVSGGSARKILVLLEQILWIQDEEKQLEIIYQSRDQQAGEFIGKLLMNSKTKWKDLMSAVDRAADQDVESLRRGILGYAYAVLKKGKSPRAYKIIESCRDNWFDSGKA